MKLLPATRWLYLAYLLAVHLALAVLAYLLLREQLYFFLLLEGLLLLSLLIGLSFYRTFMAPLRLLAQGEATMKDRDFATKFRSTNSREVNRLIELYNGMIDNLRAERSSKQEQQFFLQQLITAAPIGIVLLDFDGRITLLNPWMRQLLGMKAGAEWPDQWSSMAHPLATALSELPDDDGPLTLSLSGYRRYRVERGTFLDRGFARKFLLVQDMTQQLLEAEKDAYGKVIRMMAHEVNNSIGATNSLLGSLSEAMDESPAEFPGLAAEYLPVVIDRGEQMNRFMRHFADVIRLPAPNKRPTDLRVLAGQAATLFSARCQTAGVQLSTALPDSPVTVDIDSAQLELVLINALTNALESIGSRGGEIRLAVGQSPASITVQDNGPGIPPEVAPRLFSPFFSTKPDGQGVGLTISRDILEQHGADYRLKTVGEWTGFFVEWG